MKGGYLAGQMAEERAIARSHKALMLTRMTPGGSITVNCPYCLLYWKVENPVDVTRFVDGDGKREVKTSCSKGHTLHFRTIPEWRENRQRLGIQTRS